MRVPSNKVIQKKRSVIGYVVSSRDDVSRLHHVKSPGWRDVDGSPRFHKIRKCIGGGPPYPFPLEVGIVASLRWGGRHGLGRVLAPHWGRCTPYPCGSSEGGILSHHYSPPLETLQGCRDRIMVWASQKKKV